MLLHLTFFIPNFGMYVSSFGIYVSDFEMENSLRGKLFPWLREHFFCPFVKKKDLVIQETNKNHGFLQRMIKMVSISLYNIMYMRVGGNFFFKK